MKFKHRQIKNRIVGRFFNLIFPLQSELQHGIKANCINHKNRIREVNRIRNINLSNVVWSNTGSLIGVLITVVSVSIFPLFPIFDRVRDLLFLKIISDCFGENFLHFSLAILYILVIIIFYRLFVYAIDRVLRNLPPKHYAEISLNNMDQSETVTFVSYKMWEVVHLFDRNIGKTFKRLENILVEKNGNKSNFDPYPFNEEKIKNSKPLLLLLEKGLKNYNKNFYRTYYKLIELQILACDNLNIHIREFSHHILRFSPTLFNERITTFSLSFNNLEFALNNRQDHLFKSNFYEMKRIVDDIKNRMQKDLIQLICFDEIHKPLVGLSAVNSTSRSLNIFMRSISNVLERGTDRRDKEKSLIINNSEKSNESIDIQALGELKSILHRSKAHYGIDLLVTLENLYEKNPEELEENHLSMPAFLYVLKHKNGIDGIEENGNKQVENYFNNSEKNKLIDLINEHKGYLSSMRSKFNDIHKKNISEIKKYFSEKVEELISSSKNSKGRKIICVFGYSRVVRDALIANHDKLKSDDTLIFLFRENNTHMLDTRMFRLELSDDKKKNVRNTFTASDEFLISLINEDDTIVFIAGAEAFSTEENLLIHTNSYQGRVTKVFKKIEAHKISYSIWILANEYKVFKKLPPEKAFFRKEIFSDHYDDVDLYDFINFKGEVTLITEDGARPIDPNVTN